MRVAMGIGAITAISVMGAGFVRPSWSVTDASVADPVDQSGQSAQVGTADVRVNHVIRYVKLKPGQKAPPGAKVINAKDPAPRIVVTHVAARTPARTQRQAVVKTKTKQSGRP